MILFHPMMMQAAVTTGGGGFTPADLSGILAWYDTSSDSYLSLSGSNISSLLDRSGNSNNAAAWGTPGTKATNSDNSLPGISVAGVNDYRLSSALSNVRSVAYVTKLQNTSAATFGSQGGNYDFFEGGDYVYSNPWALSDIRNGYFWVDDTAYYPAYNALKVTTTSRYIGVALSATGKIDRIFSEREWHYAVGIFHEIIISSAEFSTTDITNLQAYFDSKWGL